MAKTMNQFWKPAIFKLSFILVMFLATALMLVVAELCVRFFWGDEINVQYTSNGLYKEQAYSSKTDGWLPNAKGSSCGKPVTINSFGLRGPNIDLNDDRKKILLLGDSVLFGVALDEEETIAAILRERLDTCIINTSVIGYGTDNYVEVLRFWIRQAKLDRVLVFFCLNDVQNDTSYVQKPALAHFADFVLAQLRSRSKFYMLMKNLISDRSKAYFLQEVQDYQPDDPDFTSAMNDLTTLKAMCDQHAIKLEIILLPYEYQLRNRDQEHIWTPQELTANFLKQHAIDHLRIDFPAFQGESLKKLYLYADGIHFSYWGHQLIAEQTIAHLMQID